MDNATVNVAVKRYYETYSCLSTTKRTQTVCAPALELRFQGKAAPLPILTSRPLSRQDNSEMCGGFTMIWSGGLDDQEGGPDFAGEDWEGRVRGCEAWSI